MNKLTRTALAVALLAANGIAATNVSAAPGHSIASFGHNFGGGGYFPEPTLRADTCPPMSSASRSHPPCRNKTMVGGFQLRSRVTTRVPVARRVT